MQCTQSQSIQHFITLVRVHRIKKLHSNRELIRPMQIVLREKGSKMRNNLEAKS